MTAETASLEPLLLTPIPSRRIWGGDRLIDFARLEIADDPLPVGELWTAYSGNAVAAGRFAGRALADAIAEQGESLLGRAAVERHGVRMPLLAKFIDAAAPLSIQVHPDDAYAARVESASGHLGKAEAWYVLEADPGAEIVWGWCRDVGAAEVREAVAAERLESLLNRVPVAAGDVIYNPPGRVHAIGAGILLYEIQQDSDLTYRLYDYGRREPDGSPRALHLDKALEVADLRGGTRSPLRGRSAGAGWSELIRTRFFVLERLDLDGSRDEVGPGHSLALLTAAAGETTLVWDGGALGLPIGSSAVVPAHMGAFRLEGRGELFRATVPSERDGTRAFPAGRDKA